MHISLRRPALVAAISFGGGIGTAYILETTILIWCLVLTVSATLQMVAALKGKGRQTAAVLFTAVCIWSGGGMYMQCCIEAPDPLCGQEGKKVRISGYADKIEKRENSVRITIENEDRRILANYYGKWEEETLEEGQWADFQGKILLPQPQRNPGCFDYRLYLRSCGIQVMMNIEEIQPQLGKTSLYRTVVADIRNTFSDKLKGILEPELSGIGIAMVFGDKSTLDEELYEDFQRNGTAHILAVSGLHVGILYSFFSFLWRGKKGVAFYFSVSGVLLLYTALADFSPSVVRAAVMIALHLGAGILHRRYDLLSAAAATFILMLASNPFQLFHAGFQLSFLAIASLGVILPFAKTLYQGVFLSSIVIQAGMLPYTAYLFNYISFGAFIANVPVIFLSGLLLPMGIVLIPLAYCSDSLFSAGAELLGAGCRILIGVNGFFYGDGITAMDVVSPSVPFLIGYYGILFFYVSEKGRILFLRKQYRQIAVCTALVGLLAFTLAPLTNTEFEKSDIVFVDVGQGDCIHVRTPDGKNYLLDGGGSAKYNVGKNTLKPYLLKNGVRKVEAAFVTHLHEDHYGGIRELAKEGMVKQIGVYEANKVLEPELCRETGGKTELIYLYGGQSVKLGDEVFLDILAPERRTVEEYQELIKKQEEENESSMIMRLRYKGVSVLITGDIDQEGETRLAADPALKEQISCDILKVAHHGSKYSTSDAFLDAVSPELAVFQVGKNNFGHPSETVIEKCRQRGIMIYRNDRSGAVGIFVEKDGRGIRIYKLIE